MVCWCVRSALAIGARGFKSHHHPILLSFKILHPHCCSQPRCIDKYPVGCECYLSVDWACVCDSEVAVGQNAPQGVERMHFECKIENESNDQGVIHVVCT